MQNGLFIPIIAASSLRRLCVLFLLVFATLLIGSERQLANAQEPRHGISMYGDPALPANFSHLSYVNPDAPQGGRLVYGVKGTYDSLNPFILKSMRTTARGMWDPQFGNLVYESLMMRSRDEPFTLYGLLAETVTMPEDRSWMEFNLHPKAKWSDGVPVTPEDVIFTYELLAEKGRPPYSNRMDRIEKIEKTGERSVKFTFNEKSDREFPLIIGISPVLPKHAIDPETFDRSSLKPPVGSGPYLIEKIEPGERITYRKNPDYWANGLPVTRGFNNFDTIVVEYFLQQSTLFEAFKKGIVHTYPDGDPAHWRRAYDFNGVRKGDVIKGAFQSDKPANMLGIVFNTRREKFSDVRVRQALAMLFDFEWVNKNLFFNTYKRTGSFWHGSDLSALGIPANAREKQLLAPFPGSVQPAVMDGTYLPAKTNATGRDRKVLRDAFDLLMAAGFTTSDGRLLRPDGTPLTIELISKNQDEESLALVLRRALLRLGIEIDVRTVDDSQYQARLGKYDYDMVFATYSASLSPGAEQVWRWGSRSRDVEGTFNYAGVASPAIDAMIDAMINARETEDYIAAVRALDRLLISGHYLIPLFHLDEQRIAHWSFLGVPEKVPLYGAQTNTWWDKRAIGKVSQ